MSIPEALVQKYREERDKRLRTDQLSQFTDLRDHQLSDLDADFYVDHNMLNAKDPPLGNGSQIKVLIAGAGIQGLMMAYRLVADAGLLSEDIVLVDKAGGFGGTWYWNRYPGVMCDIEGYCYIPLLEETGYMPKHRYSHGYEIREQCERIADRWKLRGQFCTTITHSQWNEELKRWLVTLKQDLGPQHEKKEPFTVQAKFLVLASGPLKSPHVPKLNGIDVFRSASGKVLIHTGRWDWFKSGGSEEQPDLVNLKGKRVGVIGTGATAIQVIPHVSKWAGHTYVFQRTPSYVGPQQQRVTTAEDWVKIANKKGWQYERMASLDGIFTGKPDVEDLVQDSWTKLTGMRALFGCANAIIAPEQTKEHLKNMLELDYPWTESMRARVDDEVKNETTAQNLKAWYPGFCKRPTFHDSYLALFNKPNVTLIDTDGRGIQAYSPNGVIANDKEYELDILVMATGYTTGFSDPSPSALINAAVIGRGGRSMKDKWEAEDFGTLFGTVTSGFPNLFFTTTSGSSASHNITALYSITTSLVSHIVKNALKGAEYPSQVVIDVDKAAEEAYSVEIAKRAWWFSAVPSCTPSYLNGEGALKGVEELNKDEKEKAAKMSPWGEGILSYRRMIDDWKKTERLDGLLVRSI